MPLEDLTSLGYEVVRADAGGYVAGFDRSWYVAPGDDEEAVVGEATNHKSLSDRMTLGLTTFADNYTNWSTMSAAEKDAANQQAQRALANMLRLQSGDLSSGAV